jgi:hypothetical protein
MFEADEEARLIGSGQDNFSEASAKRLNEQLAQEDRLFR